LTRFASLSRYFIRAVRNCEEMAIYKSGTIGAKPYILPLSIGDGELAETADTVVSVPDMRYWLQGGRVDLGITRAPEKTESQGRADAALPPLSRI
jgi:acyl CoA:acetate/3-ketoacid CoA transferase beta subunit